MKKVDKILCDQYLCEVKSQRHELNYGELSRCVLPCCNGNGQIMYI